MAKRVDIFDPVTGKDRRQNLRTRGKLPFCHDVTFKKEKRSEAIAFLYSDLAHGFYFVESKIDDYVIVFTDEATAVMAKMVLG